MIEQSDRELLELAAKAAGIRVEYTVPSLLTGQVFQLFFDGEHQIEWQPLDNDGDAMRLAVKLDIEVFQDQEEGGPSACAGYWGKPWRRDVSRLFIVETYASSANKGSPYAATRRAIVRAAAAVAIAGGAV